VTLAVVFGANGFIGRHVADAMRALPGMDVVGAGLGAPLPSLEQHWLDLDLLADNGRLETELRALGPNYVVNCTGATGGTTADLLRINVLTTTCLLEAIARAGIRARFVHIGSAAEYGPGAIGQPVAETACPRPVSPYGIAKLAATQLVAAWAVGASGASGVAATASAAATAGPAAGQDAVVLRVFNALGPAMPPGTLPSTALRRLTDAVASSAPRIEMGPLGAVRDFVDVRDIAAAVVAACRAPQLGAHIINVGSGTGHSARKLVQALAERVGFVGEIGEAAAGSPRSSDVPWQVADITLAERVLGWRPVHDLRSTVELMTAEDTRPKPS
jgi:nucleoside-diphosphate-sugar epimerase